MPNGARGGHLLGTVGPVPFGIVRLSQRLEEGEQAAGAAGALFGLAKTRLQPEEFTQVSKAVPGMGSLLKAAPAMAVGTSGGASAISKMAGSASGLASAAQAFSKLGLSPDMVAKAVPVLTQFVSKSGGANVGKLLAGVLK